MALENNPYYAKAQEFIRNNDLAALEDGKHVLDGDNLWLNISESAMKTREQALLEVHNRYIDIQIPLSKAESFGVKPRCECKDPVDAFNEVKDIQKFHDRYDQVVTLQPGEQITFEPDTAHAPLIGEGVIRKALFKIKVV
ncbi:MAG: YhcH/YjgK/YiaL family protein [Bacteroidales bacterium]|nr:YhcH/YjgK/YiaL family protein [Bacteroidales bacterium]